MMNWATFPGEVRDLFIQKCNSCNGKGYYYRPEDVCTKCRGTGKLGLTKLGRELLIEAAAEFMDPNASHLADAIKLRDERQDSVN